MHATNKAASSLPKIVLATALLAAVLGGCTKKDSGIGGAGDAAHVTSRTEGSGGGAAAGTSGATGNAGNAGKPGIEYNTNITPRTVGENESGSKHTSAGAVGGASGVDGKVPVDSQGTTTGGANPAGSPMQSAPATGTHTTGHTGNTTGTGPGSTKPAGGSGY